jgi:hypothetical protein
LVVARLVSVLLEWLHQVPLLLKGDALPPQKVVFLSLKGLLNS